MIQLGHTICKHSICFPSEHPLVVCNKKRRSYSLYNQIIRTESSLRLHQQIHLNNWLAEVLSSYFLWVNELMMNLGPLNFHPLGSINLIQKKKKEKQKKPTAAFLEFPVRFVHLVSFLRSRSENCKHHLASFSESTDKIWCFFQPEALI